MERGKPVPPAIGRFIVDTKTNAPELTRSQIADRVEGQFGVRLDPSTVGRTLRRERWSSAPARGSEARAAAIGSFDPHSHRADLLAPMLEFPHRREDRKHKIGQ